MVETCMLQLFLLHYKMSSAAQKTEASHDTMTHPPLWKVCIHLHFPSIFPYLIQTRKRKICDIVESSLQDFISSNSVLSQYDPICTNTRCYKFAADHSTTTLSTHNVMLLQQPNPVPGERERPNLSL